MQELDKVELRPATLDHRLRDDLQAEGSITASARESAMCANSIPGSGIRAAEAAAATTGSLARPGAGRGFFARGFVRPVGSLPGWLERTVAALEGEGGGDEGPHPL